MTEPAERPDGRPFLPREHGAHPPALAPHYKSSVLRSPRRPLVSLTPTPSEIEGPSFAHLRFDTRDNDLLVNFARAGETAQGERLIVHGRVIDERGRPVAGALIEVWQANASGRYRHPNDRYLAPLDPNFGGCGRSLTDRDGAYAFRTVRPGAYPWPNGPNEWRPSHIHFSLMGHGFAQRLITQMYFEGDPLIARCPIVQSIGDARAVARLIAHYDPAATLPMDARAYRFDLVLRGRCATFFDNRREGD